MATLDPVFGIHAQALAVHARRMEVLSSNIANADTPGYQARDVDFAKILASTQSPKQAAAATSTARIATTDPRHIPIAATGGGLAVDGSNADYRIPMQPAADRNTVDVQVEQAKFADAALHYQASLSFADSRVRSLMTAITGQ